MTFTPESTSFDTSEYVQDSATEPFRHINGVHFKISQVTSFELYKIPASDSEPTEYTVYLDMAGGRTLQLRMNEQQFNAFIALFNTVPIIPPV